MKKIIILSTFLCFFLFPLPILAETTTPEITPTTNMEDKIKLLVQENLSTTEAKLKEKLDLQTLVGFAGKITSISSNNLTIDSHNDVIQITTSTATVIQKNSSPLKFSSLAIGDKIIVIGTSVKTDILQAKKISVIKDEPVLVTTTASVTKIVSIDLKKKTLVLTLNGTNQTLTLSKKSTVKLEDLKPSQTIFGIIKEYQGNLSLAHAKSL